MKDDQFCCLTHKTTHDVFLLQASPIKCRTSTAPVARANKLAWISERRTKYPVWEKGIGRLGRPLSFLVLRRRHRCIGTLESRVRSCCIESTLVHTVCMAAPAQELKLRSPSVQEIATFRNKCSKYSLQIQLEHRRCRARSNTFHHLHAHPAEHRLSAAGPVKLLS